MKAKLKERKLACKLRSNGMAITEIARSLGVSKSSVSNWVRHIELTEQQEAALLERVKRNKGILHGGKAVKAKWKSKRKAWRLRGAELARKGNQQLIQIALLHWAEGRKSRNSFSFCNSDVRMMRFVVSGMRQIFDIEDSDFQLTISAYESEGITYEDIVSYWVTELEIHNADIRPRRIDNRENSGRFKGKLPYGICDIRIRKSVEIVQTIYGALQWLIKIEDSWFDEMRSC